MIFDSHAHYDDESFNDDREVLLSEILPKKNVVGIINCASDFESIEKTIKLSETYKYVYAALGIHPECAARLPENWLSVLEEGLKKEKTVALGEIGLDYYWEDSCPRDIQKEVFIKQLKLAKKYDIPVIIHDRDAHGDTLEILKEFKPKGVVHCFSGSAQMAREVVKLGMYIGMGGVVTFKNARHSVEVMKDIPLDKLLLETDAPYLSPVPMRGKRNDSSLIPYAAAKIGELRDLSATEILEISRNNIKALFGI